MNGVQTRFKCKLDVKRCKRFVFPPSSLLPRSNALKTKAIRYFQTDRTLTRIVSPPLQGYLNDIISRRTTDTSQQVSTETFTLDRILKERRKELVGEGEVFYDYLRNGLAIERKGSWHLETLKASNAQKIEATDLRIALPIPQSEIDANPNIQQNPR